jgi:hypothetical protein
MKSIARRLARPALLLVAVAYSSLALANYFLTTTDYPGATSTDVGSSTTPGILP